MPIIEPCASTSPLRQGDLLRGINLYLTSKTDQLAGGECALAQTSCCLVVSRPCVTAHKTAVIVAAVEKMKSTTPGEVDSLDRAVQFLTRIRDGANSPDVFYLGHLFGQEAEGRFAARLDSLHTIEIPGKPDSRKAFLEKHRFATLHADFSRDLHARIFQSFASMGFEDISWFSTIDLRFSVQTAQSEIKSLEAGIDRLKAATAADGGKGSEIKTLTNRIESLKTRLAPYQRELEKRSS